MTQAAPDPHALLRHHGLQVTAQRLAVLRAVSERPHATTDEVFQGVRAELGAISRQAVYDALAAFTAQRLLRRIQPAGSPARYETRTGDNHHHLICRTCHRTVDVDCAAGYAPCLTVEDDAGFEIDEAEVIYWGRCPECVAVAAAAEAVGGVKAADDAEAADGAKAVGGPKAAAAESKTAERTPEEGTAT